MDDMFKVSTQGISEDLEKSSGNFATIDRGMRDIEQLLTILERTRSFATPDKTDFACFPHVLVEGSAGTHSFYGCKGRLFEASTREEITSYDAILLVLGRTLEDDNYTPAPELDITLQGIAADPDMPHTASLIWKTRWVLFLSNTAFFMGCLCAVQLFVNIYQGDQTILVPCIVSIAFLMLHLFLKKIGREVFMMGIDWNQGVFWIIRGNAQNLYILDNVHLIANIAPNAIANSSTNPFSMGMRIDAAKEIEPTIFGDAWFLSADRVDKSQPALIPGAVFAVKKEAVEIARQANALLASQL